MADIKTLVEDVKNAYFDSLPYEIDVAIMERNGGATDTAFSEASAKVDALFAILDALAEAHQAEVARLTRERDAAISAHEVVQNAGFHFRQRLTEVSSQKARLRDALEEVCRVLETNTTAITDTVWVSTGMPETLLDHCRVVLAGASGAQEGERT